MPLVTAIGSLALDRLGPGLPAAVTEEYPRPRRDRLLGGFGDRFLLAIVDDLGVNAAVVAAALWALAAESLFRVSHDVLLLGTAFTCFIARGRRMIIEYAESESLKAIFAKNTLRTSGIACQLQFGQRQSETLPSTHRLSMSAEDYDRARAVLDASGVAPRLGICRTVEAWRRSIRPRCRPVGCRTLVWLCAASPHRMTLRNCPDGLHFLFDRLLPD
jgi:hypothetical protein